MSTYLEKAKDKKIDQAELIARWEVDKDLLYLSKYTMKGPDGKHEVKGIINVTLNLPARFANDVIAMLGTAKEQAIVESDDKNLDTTYIESFRTAAFTAANARLKWELNPWWDFHSSIRGGCGARCIFQMENDILIPDITPWDIAYIRYEEGVNGLDWASYECKMNKGAIESELWYKSPLRDQSLTLKVKDNEVLEAWDKEHSEIWLNDRLVFQQPHTFGFTPVVVKSVTTGSMLADSDSLAHEGEGIFFLIRGSVPELQRLLSIMQTLNFISLKPPKGWGSREGQGGEAPEYDEVISSGSLTAHDIGGGVTDINFGDAQRSAQLAYGIMEKAIREATVAASDLGVIESPPASGVRAMIAGENRDQLLSPRLGVKALMNQGLADMFTAQVIQIGGSVELGTTRHKRTFETSKLDGQYEGYYKYTIKSAAVDAGRASLAAAYGNLIPERAKRTEILQREDPDGDESQLRWEEAERLSPGVKRYRTLKTLIEMDEDEEARIMSDEAGVELQKLLSGEIAELKPEKTDEPTQVLSLFGGGGGRTQPPTMQEEE